jgi:hypothetical protein
MNQMEWEVDLLPLHNAEVKNIWSYTSASHTSSQRRAHFRYLSIFLVSFLYETYIPSSSKTHNMWASRIYAPAVVPSGTLGGPQGRSGGYGEDKFSCPCLESNPGRLCPSPFLWLVSIRNPISINNMSWRLYRSAYSRCFTVTARQVNREWYYASFYQATARQTHSRGNEYASNNSASFENGVFYQVRAEGL